MLFQHLQSHDWPAIDALVREAGMTPLNSAFLHLFAFAPGGVFSFKLAVFLLIVAMAWLVYVIGLEAGLGRLPAACVAALQMVFPGFQDWVLLATAASVFDFALFLLATWVILRAERAAPVARRVMQLGAVAVFILSFGFNSLLPFYFGSLLLLLLVALRSASFRDLVRSRWLYAVVLIAMPIAYWELSQRLFAPSGLYGGVYSFSTEPSAVFASFEHFVRNGILEQARHSLAVLFRPWAWPAIAALVGILVVARRRILRVPATAPVIAIGGAALGLALIGLAILPYALVGKAPAVHGWDSRHDLLIGLPVAVLLVSLVSAALPAGRRSLLGLGVLGLAAIGLTGAGIQDYAAIQARWATDRAVMAELQDAPDGGAFSVYWVQDGAPGPEDFYRFYEWAAMLGNVYGDESRVGLDVRAYNPTFLERRQFFSDRYNLANLDPHGCQAHLTIEPTKGAGSRGQTALLYTFYRLFQPDRIDSFIRSLVTIQVVPIPDPYATSCSR